MHRLSYATDGHFPVSNWTYVVGVCHVGSSYRNTGISSRNPRSQANIWALEHKIATDNYISP